MSAFEDEEYKNMPWPFKAMKEMDRLCDKVRQLEAENDRLRYEMAEYHRHTNAIIKALLPEVGEPIGGTTEKDYRTWLDTNIVIFQATLNSLRATRKEAPPIRMKPVRESRRARKHREQKIARSDRGNM